MLTEQEKTAYVEKNTHCPYCGSDQLAGDNYDAEGNVITQLVTCLSCKKTWSDVYRLVSIYEEGGK